MQTGTAPSFRGNLRHGLNPVGVPRGGIAVAELTPFLKVCEIHPEGPPRRKEGTLSGDRKFSWREMGDPVELKKETPTPRPRASAC